eukprot:6193603-Pleurochrysis_carterae.AAC.2
MSYCVDVTVPSTCDRSSRRSCVWPAGASHKRWLIVTTATASRCSEELGSRTASPECMTAMVHAAAKPCSGTPACISAMQAAFNAALSSEPSSSAI